MGKKLIICADGTWNAVEKNEHGVRVSTNVARVAAFLDHVDSNKAPQLVCYLEGVGTKEEESFTGGAFGWGLSANIEQAYRFLVGNFDQGDELFFFGFSRGAFTARSLAGLIYNCGIVRRGKPGAVEEAMALYRDRRDTTDPTSIRARVFRKQHSHETNIRFVGVWDTVGALGSPLIRHKIAKILGWDWSFHDPSLGPHIEHAAHALAIHETRGGFLPTLWIRPPEAPKTQILEQVWFSGCHSDIGGGYAESGLSDLSLEWMIEQATRCGLQFRADWRTMKLGTGQKFVPDSDRQAPFHNEFKGFWTYLDAIQGCPMGVCRRWNGAGLIGKPQAREDKPASLLHRFIAKLSGFLRKTIPGKSVCPTVDTDEKIHASVYDRFKNPSEGDWWPPDFLEKLSENKQAD